MYLMWVFFFYLFLAQCERPNVGGNLALADESGQETFSDGAKVKLKCATGYMTDARTISRSITCTGTQWSQIELYCKSNCLLF